MTAMYQAEERGVKTPERPARTRTHRVGSSRSQLVVAVLKTAAIRTAPPNTTAIARRLGTVSPYTPTRLGRPANRAIAGPAESPAQPLPIISVTRAVAARKNPSATAISRRGGSSAPR
ncbi:hypothetical protein [Streptomyces albus]|uniref:hypothetical protein n=1 Tax=Streptomyces albus TaxID=1888 RepID=UPI001FAC0184|nr:hypothetical protein [Streptomyces albus]